LEITVTADDLRELPAAVEVAAYRIATEAVTNAVRHAAARHCHVTLMADGLLTIEVTDDGQGLPDDPTPGVGLSSMRERAEELGGSFTATRLRTRGTRVRATIPLAAP
jgi:signal transduction histidine kinase